MNQPKESKAQEALFSVRLWKVLQQVRSYVSFFYFLHMTARENGLKPSTGSQKKKSGSKLDSLEQKEVVRSHFVPPQTGSTY